MLRMAGIVTTIGVIEAFEHQGRTDIGAGMLNIQD